MTPQPEEYVATDEPAHFDVHITCRCQVCSPTNDPVPSPPQDLYQPPGYATWEWYRTFVHQLAQAEYMAHEDKRFEYCGPKDADIFWMIQKAQEDTGLDFNQIWMAWASRHFSALLRAVQKEEPRIIGQRALDLMGWLFLILAAYQPINDPE